MTAGGRPGPGPAGPAFLDRGGTDRRGRRTDDVQATSAAATVSGGGLRRVLVT